jgi:hypothetical protein
MEALVPIMRVGIPDANVIGAPEFAATPTAM